MSLELDMQMVCQQEMLAKFYLTHVGIVNVTFSVTYQTAAASDVIITPSNGVVTLQDGQLSVPINIVIIDDNYPELNEELQLQLTGVTG